MQNQLVVQPIAPAYHDHMDHIPGLGLLESFWSFRLAFPLSNFWWGPRALASFLASLKELFDLLPFLSPYQ